MHNYSAQTAIVSRVENKNGEAVYVAPRNTSGAQTQFHILVKKSGDDWVPVTELNSSVDRFSFQTDFGFLPSQLDEQGTPLNLNSGQGRLESPGLRYRKEANTYTAGEELVMTDDGRLVLHSKSVSFPEGHKPSRKECADILEFHYDDSQWAVRS